MSYTTIDTLKKRIEYTGEDFYNLNPDIRFEDLLKTVQSEAKGLIDSYMGNETLEFEEDREDELRAPDNAILRLTYPVREVKSVKISQNGEDWHELSEKSFTKTKFGIKLRRVSRSGYISRGLARRIGRTSMRDRADVLTWRDRAELVRVTYDRGYSLENGEMPTDIQNIEITLVNKMLRSLKQEQAIKNLDPTNVETYFDYDELMKEEIVDRIKNIERVTPRFATL